MIFNEVFSELVPIFKKNALTFNLYVTGNQRMTSLEKDNISL